MRVGGTKLRSGPPADPNALVRNKDRADWTRLPKVGCTLSPPEWPIELGEMSVQEEVVWNRLWRTPQAIVWHNDGVADTVVLYVRALIFASNPGASSASIICCRQLSEALLLSIPAMRQARYFIEGGPEEVFAIQDPDGPPRVPEKPGVDGADNVRDMFRILRPEDDDDDNSDSSAAEE